ncbi:MAG: hypothetical protein CBB69_009105 [Phycisphaera sp. TMED9]|nr:MAG: hypothetical protein CBB69_009105 [Phycisphaera sp. TMED9]
MNFRTKKLCASARTTAFILAAVVMSGCVTDGVESTTGRPLPPAPRDVAPASESSSINAISVLKSQQPMDTTGNGFPNLLGVGVYLFARPYPIPRFADGTLVFSLFPPGEFDQLNPSAGEPVVSWTFGPDMMAGAQVENLIGPGYQLSLDIGAVGLSSLEVDSADMVVQFIPAQEGDGIVYSSVQRVPFRLY